MARGGKRQGQPGAAYSNRTDLAQNYDNAGGSAAGGEAQYEQPAPQGPTPRSPDDSPMLRDPSMRPDEALTTGLSSGPGAGPEALGFDTRGQEATKLKAKWLPILQPVIEQPDTPDSVKMMFRYLRGA